MEEHGKAGGCQKGNTAWVRARTFLGTKAGGRKKGKAKLGE